MNFEPSTAIAIIVPSVTALVWLLRLEGRINTNEFATSACRKDIIYIRDRIDTALKSNGGYTHRRADDDHED